MSKHQKHKNFVPIQTKNKDKIPVKNGKYSREFVAKFPVIAKIPLIRNLIYWFFNEGLFYSVGVSLIVLVFFMFATHNLGKFFTSDEIQFLQELIPNYFNAWKSGHLEKTMVFDKPAVLTILLAGISNLFININHYSPANFDEYLFWWRFPAILFNAICLVFIYNLTKKLTSVTLAFLLIGMLAFTPVIIGMGQIVNADSVIWSTSFISILSYLLLIKTGEKKYIFYSGISFGLALISKYNAQILYIFYFAYIYFDYLFQKSDRKQFLKNSLNLLYIILIAWLVLIVFIPGVIFKFSVLIFYTLGQLLNSKLVFIVLAVIYIEVSLLKGFVTEKLRTKLNLSNLYIYLQSSLFIVLILFLGFYYLFMKEPFQLLTAVVKLKSIETFFPAFFQNINAMVTTTNIPTILGIFIFLIVLLIPAYRKKIAESDQRISLYFFTTILLFYVGAAMVGFINIHRYAIMIYPVFFFLVACLITTFFKQTKIVSIVIFLIFMVDVIAFPAPDFFSYQNNSYFKKDGLKSHYAWGYGGYQAAEFANKLPGASGLKILSDYQGFAQFFVGTNQIMNQRITSDIIKQFDYLCLSSDGFPQKIEWQMMGYSLLEYYQEPLNKAAFYVGSESTGWVKLVKVDKNKVEKSLPNTFDPDFYFDFNKSFSVAFWMNFGNEKPGIPLFISHDGKNGISIKDSTIDSKCIFKINYLNDNKFLQTSVLNDNKWHNVIISHNPNNDINYLSIYIDGKKIGVLENKYEIVEQKFLISTIFNGFVQDVRIYNFALSENQILKIYNNGTIILDDKLNDGVSEFAPIQHFTKK